MKQTNLTEIGFEHIPEWVDVNYIDNDTKVAILVQFKCPNVLSLCSDKFHEE